MKFKKLTCQEEQLMLVLWDIEQANVKDIIKSINQDPKPAYNTVSTFIRILVKKGFVGYNKYGRNHVYFALIKKEDYVGFSIDQLIKNYYFSMSNLFVHLNNYGKISEKEMENIYELLRNYNLSKN